MKIVLFVHSLASCWNHGNAHFLRGVARALLAAGHEVAIHEPAGGWSAANLTADGGDSSAFDAAYPELAATAYGDELDLDRALDGADAVVVHEWNDPALVARIGAHPTRAAKLFHDTHHRAVSDPQAIRAFDLSRYDGVLAFGAVLTEVYQRWGHRAWTWHEAADITHFRPPRLEQPREGLVWVGNWGDGERSAELVEFLLAPARAAGLALDIHGVRYPGEARATLAAYGARYHGWLANAAAPGVFARALATVHVPRRHYVEALPGIPTIRVFEALACGVPLLSAPWHDAEGLFRVGTDLLIVPDGGAMERVMRDVANDAGLRASLARHGLETIRARHTCAHRADELVAIVRGLAQPQRAAA